MKYIYHITKKETWETAKKRNIYDYCSLKTSNFIHTSTKDQYLQVANRLFKQEENLVLLKINPETVNSEIIYENLEGGTQMFPHIYGAFKPESVVEVYKLQKSQKGDFLDLGLIE